MPRAQSSQPTQFEGLARIQPPKTSVQPQSQYSYNETRAGYVERPHGDYQAFARMIRGFGDEANKALNAFADRMIDEQVAKGRELYAENPDLDKNKRNWKDYAEEHPNDISRFWSPFLQRGYEEARLKCLSMDEKKAMDEAFMQSGLVNETDPQKIADWQQQFTQQFRKDNMLDKYEDKLMLARNFSPLEFANRQELLQRHTQIVVAQREQRLVEMQTQLALSEADVAFKGRRIMDGDAGVFANIIMKNAEVARANGMLDKNMPEMMANAVFTYYEQNKRNPSILKALDQIVTPSGAKLSSLPGIQKKINDAERQRIAEARADTSWSWQVQNHQRQEQARFYQGQFLVDIMKSGKPITSAEELEKMGVRPEYWAGIMKAQNDFFNSQRNTFLNAPDNQTRLAAMKIAAGRGDIGVQELIGYAENVGADEIAKLAEATTKAHEGESKTLADYFKEVGKYAADFFKGKNNGLSLLFAGDLNDATMATIMGTANGNQQKQVEAMAMVQALASTYANGVREKTGHLPSIEELRSQTPKFLQQVLDTYGTGKQEQPKIPAAPMMSSQTPQTNTAVSPMQTWFSQNMPGINFAAFDGNFQKMGEAVQASGNQALIDNFNALIRSMAKPK